MLLVWHAGVSGGVAQYAKFAKIGINRLPPVTEISGTVDRIPLRYAFVMPDDAF